MPIINICWPRFFLILKPRKTAISRKGMIGAMVLGQYLIIALRIIIFIRIT